MAMVPQRQRVAAYAVIVRDDRILLSRLAERVTRDELWTLPGGGLDHGEDPRDGVVREVSRRPACMRRWATGPGPSAHLPGAWRDGARVDAHALRIVYDGWVPRGSPEPRVVEVDGSTAEAAWVALDDVRSGAVPVVPMVTEVLGDLAPLQRQRLAAYAVIRRDDAVLLTRISPVGHHSGSWTLPGGGVDHGERPAVALAREVAEECGVEVASATCSTCTTCTSPAWRRPAGSRTSTAST